MFKKNNGTMSKNKSGGQESSYNLIATGTTIQGEITSDGDIRIDGILIGKAKASGRVVIGVTGSVDGEIICENADISGSVKGQVQTSGLLHLKATAKILGDISANKLAIDPGATFTGACNMGSEPISNNSQLNGTSSHSLNGNGELGKIEELEEVTAQ